MFVSSAAGSCIHPLTLPVLAGSNALTFLHSALWIKGTGQSCAFVLPLWADGGDLLVPVPFPAYGVFLRSLRELLLPDDAKELLRLVHFLFL